VIEDVQPGSSSDESLAPGDVLVRINGALITGFEPLEALLDDAVGKQVTIELERGGQPITAQLTVGDLDAITPSAYLEFSDAILHTLSYQQARHFHVPVAGAFVAAAGYSLDAAGILRGAVITQINAAAIGGLDELISVVAPLADGERIAVRYFTIDDRNAASCARFWSIAAGFRRAAASVTMPSAPGTAVSCPRPHRTALAGVGAVSDVGGCALRGWRRRWSRSTSTCRTRCRGQRRNYQGAGLILDAERGLVITDRNTVPVSIGDVRLTFASTLEIPAEVVYVHPLHNLAVVKYDPPDRHDTGAQRGAGNRRAACRANRSSGRIRRQWRNEVAFDRDRRGGSADSATVAFGAVPRQQSGSGDPGQSARRRGWSAGRQGWQGAACGPASPATMAVNWCRKPRHRCRNHRRDAADRARSGNRCARSKAGLCRRRWPMRAAGLSDDWMRHSAGQPVGASGVERLPRGGRLGCSASATARRPAAPSTTWWSRASVMSTRGSRQVAGQGHGMARRRRTDRERADRALSGNDVDPDLLGRRDLAGATSRHQRATQHRAAGVYVAYFAFGSPATRYGLQPGRRIVEIDGQPTPNLDVSLNWSPAAPIAARCASKTVGWNGAPEVKTLSSTATTGRPMSCVALLQDGSVVRSSNGRSLLQSTNDQGRATQLELDTAVQALRDGEVVVFPTETVYGLGANAQHAAALQRVFQLKARPTTHPLIVHLDSPRFLHRWVRAVPVAAEKLAARFWPGPLTLVLPRADNVLDLVTGGQPTVAIRVPSHPMAQQLLTAFGGGIAAPSANRHGHVSPTRAEHVRDEFGDAVPVILDGGECKVGLESTIVDCSGAVVRLLRPGSITLSQLRRVVGDIVVGPGRDAPRVPGSQQAHYAPTTPLSIIAGGDIDRLAETLSEGGPRIAVLARRPPLRTYDVTWINAGTRVDAYGDLYANLRALDKAGAARILVQEVPADERWDALRDRLARASALPRADAGDSCRGVLP
jgi:L-threonylcarbamoyladenylate synthase